MLATQSGNPQPVDCGSLLPAARSMWLRRRVADRFCGTLAAGRPRAAGTVCGEAPQPLAPPRPQQAAASAQRQQAAAVHGPSPRPSGSAGERWGRSRWFARIARRHSPGGRDCRQFFTRALRPAKITLQKETPADCFLFLPLPLNLPPLVTEEEEDRRLVKYAG